MLQNVTVYSLWFNFQWTYLKLPDGAGVICRFGLGTFLSLSPGCAQQSRSSKCGSWGEIVVVIWNVTWQSKDFFPKSHYNIVKLCRSGCASRHTLLDAIFVLPWKTFIHHLPTLTAPNKTTTPIHLHSSTHLHPLSLAIFHLPLFPPSFVM